MIQKQECVCEKCGKSFPEEGMHIVSAHDPEYGARLKAFCKPCNANMPLEEKISIYKKIWEILLEKDSAYYGKLWESFTIRILNGA